jgi:hypothetical protein
MRFFRLGVALVRVIAGTFVCTEATSSRVPR